ncbi:MAG: hypothetical protein MHPDNHAH_02856 [Anaerolineales bacterium]|nr:hypothetical protein [Anaerolineales bacterium]WKZ48804.1 MAG: hypothetical protein QY306_05460 [Anaerolineales bacterium]
MNLTRIVFNPMYPRRLASEAEVLRSTRSSNTRRLHAWRENPALKKWNEGGDGALSLAGKLDGERLPNHPKMERTDARFHGEGSFLIHFFISPSTLLFIGGRRSL